MLQRKRKGSRQHFTIEEANRNRNDSVCACVCVCPARRPRTFGLAKYTGLKRVAVCDQEVCTPATAKKASNLTQVELEEERRGFSDIHTQCRNYTSVFSTNSNSPPLPVAWPSISSSSSSAVLLCSASAVQCFLYNRNGPIFFLLPKSAVPFSVCVSC